MKITVDVRPLLGARTGIGQYTYHLLREFMSHGNGHEYQICGALGLLGVAPIEPGAGPQEYQQVIERKVLPLRVPFPFRKAMRLTAAFLFPLALRRSGTEVFWGTNFLGFFGSSFNTVITIHDMAYVYYPRTIHPVMYKDLKRKLRDHAHRAHRIITVSEHAKADIVRLLGVPAEKIRVVPNGVSPEFQPIRDQAKLGRVREKYRLPQRFLLFVGMLEPRKNLVNLLRVFHALARNPHWNHSLVLAGAKGWGYQEIFQTVRNLGLQDRVIFPGYVADEDLPSLYSLADVFLYPSLYEGCGMPVVEAMACGVPVIASRASALPETAGDAALYVDPSNVEEIARAANRVIKEGALRQSLIERGLSRSRQFSWEKSARATLAVLEDAAEMQKDESKFPLNPSL